eukprot:gene23546-9070_t
MAAPPSALTASPTKTWCHLVPDCKLLGINIEPNKKRGSEGKRPPSQSSAALEHCSTAALQRKHYSSTAALQTQQHSARSIPSHFLTPSYTYKATAMGGRSSKPGTGPDQGAAPPVPQRAAWLDSEEPVELLPPSDSAYVRKMEAEALRTVVPRGFVDDRGKELK